MNNTIAVVVSDCLTTPNKGPCRTPGVALIDSVQVDVGMT